MLNSSYISGWIENLNIAGGLAPWGVEARGWKGTHAPSVVFEGARKQATL